MRRESLPPTLLLAAIAIVGSSTISQAGTLIGSLTTGAAVNRNLTVEGTEDWAIWGFANGGTSTSLTPDDHKAGGFGISALTDFSNGNPLRGLGQFGAFAHSFDWTDGTPVASFTGALGGIQNNSMPLSPNPVGEGFSFQVPASPTLRTLRVYVATHLGTSRLTASLSDGSAANFVQDQGDNVSENLPGVYEIQYAANSAAQTLNVSFVLTQGSNTSHSNAQVHAVSLAQNTTTPAIPLVRSPTSPAGLAMVALLALAMGWCLRARRLVR